MQLLGWDPLPPISELHPALPEQPLNCSLPPMAWLDLSMSVLGAWCCWLLVLVVPVCSTMGEPFMMVVCEFCERTEHIGLGHLSCFQSLFLLCIPIPITIFDNLSVTNSYFALLEITLQNNFVSSPYLFSIMTFKTTHTCLHKPCLLMHFLVHFLVYAKDDYIFFALQVNIR